MTISIISVMLDLLEALLELLVPVPSPFLLLGDTVDVSEAKLSSFNGVDDFDGVMIWI